ncbi:hypothetical protein BVI1335_830055 [Burkholderia vietnamiensis]|nr:hypothetical protein BVI1335_830055 [Burkholderia vietnamiensis]
MIASLIFMEARTGLFFALYVATLRLVRVSVLMGGYHG